MGWFALAAALTIGTLTRFWHLDGASLFTDEAYSFAIGQLPVPALLETVARSDYHPPLFYLATHGLLQLVHLRLWDYRYAAAPFGLLTIAATWGAARKMFGDVAAAMAAIAVALSPALITFDRIYRMYAVLVALSTVSWWLLVEAEAAQGRRRFWLWASYAILAVALAYTHYLGLLVLACQAIYATVNWRSRPAFIAYGLTAIAYLPWLPSMRAQLSLGGMAIGRPGLDLGLARSVGGAFAPGLPDSVFSWSFGIWTVVVAILAIAIAGGWIGWRSALPFWLAPLGLAVFLSIALGRNLAYFPRYLLVDIPPVAIALGVLVAKLSATRARLAAFAVGAACVGVLGVASTNVLVNPYYQFPDWYAVNDVMRADESPKDTIVLDAAYEYLVVRDYSAFRGHRILSFMNATDFRPIFGFIATHPEARIWYVQAQNEYWDPERRIEAALAHRPIIFARRFPRQAWENEVTVMLFGPEPGRGM